MQDIDKNQDNLILDVENLTVRFYRDEGVVKPINGVTMRVYHGQSVGVVGESGCGKTMTAYSLLGILPKGGQVERGSIRYRMKNDQWVDLARAKPRGKEFKQVRGGEISMIFQEPMTAFSPVHTIYNQIAEAIRLHCPGMNKAAIRRRVIELLGLVGIPDPPNRLSDYTFQFSGGMRQRAMIAMALSTNPSLLIADEPTTALDVTVQAQVLKLIKDTQRQFGLALMLITHDLGVIAHTVDHVYVMYLGRVVEEGPVNDIFDEPRHPYTIDLLNSIPKMEARQGRIEPIRGSVPDTYSLPSGCPFHPRCARRAGDVCTREAPARVQVGNEHYVSCFKYAGVEETVGRNA